MTIEKALKPGTDHHAESTRVAKLFNDTASAATAMQTAPLPAGTQAQATTSLPVKTTRTTTAKC